MFLKEIKEQCLFTEDKHRNKKHEIYEKIADEFNKEILSKTANLVALLKDVYSIEKVVSIKNVRDVNKLFVCLRGWCVLLQILRKKSRNEKLNSDKFIQSSEINYAKILWLQVNQQTLEEEQNFINLKHTLRLEKHKSELYHIMSRIGNANSLPYDTKYSIILNRDHSLTELLVWDAQKHIKKILH